MERSRSVPVGQRPEAEVNPFYSAKLRDRLALEAQRPVDLPVPEDDGLDEPRPLLDGRGNGERPGKGHGVVSGPARSGCFVTPPSRRSEHLGKPESGPVAVPRGMGERSEGMMPTEECLKTDGPMQKDSETPPQQRYDELQRALETEIVDQLRRQNLKLLEELEALKQQQQQRVGSSTASWSEVGGESGGRGRDQGPVGGLDGRVTPRNLEVKVNEAMRFTPNGTQVPLGSPPKQDDDIPAPPPPPPVPLFPDVRKDEQPVAMSIDQG